MGGQGCVAMLCFGRLRRARACITRETDSARWTWTHEGAGGGGEGEKTTQRRSRARPELQ